MTWRAGDIGAETNGSRLARLIQLGQRLRRSPSWRWNHIFVVVDDQGGTIEAQGSGVVRSSVGTRTVINLGCPAGVDRLEVVAAARRELGVKYNYLGVILLGVDCVFGTNLHWHSQRVRFCSELAVTALKAGGWRSPRYASETKPADLVDELGTVPT